MVRITLSIVVSILVPSLALAQPSFSKDIRPFFTKYCLECHNAKTEKAGLVLESYKSLMDGSDGGPVIKAGKPDDSRLVLLCEGKDKPVMPPPKAKFQPTKDEIKLLRAWVQAGAMDDAASVKIELPVIKAKRDVLPPVRGVGYDTKSKGVVFIRGNELFKERSVYKPFYRASREMTALVVCQDDSELFGVDFGNEGSRLIMAASAIWLPKGNQGTILDIAFSPKSKVAATADHDGKIALFNMVKMNSPRILKEHSDAVYGLAFSPDGKLLASVSADRAMKVFDVEKGKLLYTLGEATDWLYCAAWSPDGKYLVSGGADKSLRVYEPTAQGAKLRQSVFAHEGPVQKIVFTSDSKTLYSVGQDRIVKAWDIEKMVERKVYDRQPETVLCLALREDAGQFIVGRYDGIVELIDMKTGKVVHEFGKEKQKAKPDDERSDSPGSCGDDPREESRGVKTTDGVLDRAGTVNQTRFDAVKGQQLGVQLIATEKSKLEAVLTLTDKTGRILAESYDGHLGHTFADAGSYMISVRDRDYRGGLDFKYQLRMGEIPVVTAVFPMGLQRGAKGDVQIDGVFLPKKSITMSIPPDAKIGQTMPLPIGAGVLGKAQIVVGEFPEVSAGGKIPVPGTANGRIEKDNQNDVWTFPAKKCERLIVEVNARRIGSRLDSVIEILDANDQPVPRAVLRSQAKTNVTFRDHDSVQGNVRIETWSELTTNDLLYVGNELMKIQALPTHPDADCNFFATGGKRLGYLDTTPTHHANNTPMYKVSVHPPGTIFPPNGFPVFTLYYKNDDGGPGYGRDSRIVFDPPADGVYKVRIADARGMGGANFGYRLTVRPPRPSFEIRFSPTAPAVPVDGGTPLTVSVDRLDGYDGPIAVRFGNLAPGMNAPATTIEAGTYSTAVSLYYQPAVPYKPAPLKVIGEALIDGRKVTKESLGEIPKVVVEPADIRTWTDELAVAIKPGQQAKLIVHIERKPGFTGRVPLDVRGLPHGVRVLDIGLNGILVNENETKRTVVIYAEPWVQAQEHPFVVLAKREGKGTEYAARSVVLKVR